MRIIISIIFLVNLLTSQSSLAQNFRSTTFDQRSVCEKNQGVWREFGNGCVDNCRAQLNKFQICTTALTYGCDCGQDRCWYDGQCVDKQEYKKSYDLQQSKEKARLEKQKRLRREKYDHNRRMIVKRLKNISDVEEQVSDVKQKVKDLPNPVVSVEPNKNDQEHTPLVDLFVSGGKKILEHNKKDSKAGDEPKYKIPEFFARQQQKAAQQNDTNSTTNGPNANTTLPQQNNNVDKLPTLPTVVLPK